MKASNLLAAVILVAHGVCYAANKPPPPLTLYPACPCYLLVGEGNGQTRIDATVNLDPALRSGSVVRIELIDSVGTTLQTASVSASAGGIVGTTLQVPVAAVAKFYINALLLDSNGKQIGKAATDVHVCPPDQARVEIGPDGFLRVAGKPEFPIGLYSAAHYGQIAKAGFTVTHNYEITTGEAADPINPNDARLKELLDQSWANGMRMMVELPRHAVEQAAWTQIRRRIETFRHHPGLLCWDSEERVARGKAPLKNIAELYQLVHSLDPDHPFVLGDSRDLSKNMLKDRRNFFPDTDMDAGIWWWYPIPLRTNQPLLEPPSWLTATATKKPLWIAIQAYVQPWEHSRYPTPAEYRSMAYLSIINGVKGLFFYTGSGERDFHHKPAGLLNQPEHSHWDYVQTLLHELHEVTPIIMAPTAGVHVALSPSDAPVDFTTREFGGKLYLIAANKSVNPQTVKFAAPELAGRHVELLYEPRPAAIEGNALNDTFEPLGVRVYKFE
ncbi:MAG TPA: hypothetical protein VGN61_01135 [Verrucomicrobiae bacterium]